VIGLSRPVVCVVIPTLNESGTIGALIESLEGLGGLYDVGIVVVDDGSTDGTVEIVRESGERYGNLVLVERGRRLGLGTAIRDGLRVALDREPAPDFVVTMDGDLSHDPGELPSLVEACGRGSLVVGSRYVEGGRVRGWGLRRRAMSRGANVFARAFAGVPLRDCTSGFRCYGVDLVGEVLPSLGSVGFEIQVEVLSEAAHRGFKVVEVPITFRERVEGRSKLGLREVLGFARRVFQLSLKTRARAAEDDPLIMIETMT
jgi:dolichol-phosphate mannosyltransferase